MHLIRRRSTTTASALSAEPAHPTRTRSLLQVAGFGLLDLFLFSDLQNRSDSVDRAAPPPGLVWPAVGLVALTGMAILLRRHRAPVRVFLLLALLSVLTCQFLPYRPLVLVGCAWFVVTSTRGWRVAAWCVPAVLGLVAGWTLDELRDDPTLRSWSGALGVGTGYLVLMVGIGVAGRSRLASLIMLRISERRRREEIRDERLRLARELHDVVMHAVTLMVVQAEAARTTVATDPEATSASLAAISRAGARATAELREMLQVLRPVGSPGEVPAAPPSPAVALSATASLDDLVASARDAGVHVELEYDLQDRDGGTGRLDPAVRLTVVRTVQEALTNTLRHSGPGTRVRVAVRDVPDGLLVEVVDDGKRAGDGAEGSGTDGIPADPVIASPLPPTEIRAGNGLVGLAERAAALGGTLRHGPRTDRGYGVLLRLPLTPPSVDLTTGWTTDLAIGQAEGQIIHGGPR